MITETEIGYFFFFLLIGPAAIVAIFNILFLLFKQLEELYKRIKGEKDKFEQLYLESVEWMEMSKN
jgi:di/tricarboxylate transporter